MLPWYLWFSWRESSLSHSTVFLSSFALITEKGFLISPCYSLELCIQMGISFLFSFAFSFSIFPLLFIRPPQTAILLFCISFSWGWSWFLSPVQCHEPLSIVFRHSVYQIIPWIYLSLPLYNCKGFNLGHTWMLLLSHFSHVRLCATPWMAVHQVPPVPPSPGILQARTLEWAAISFSNAWKWKMKVV